jgi:hypothetical protein
MAILDLFKPKWKNSNWIIRRDAMESITDQAILAEVVKKDSDLEVRMAALQRITDQIILAEIVNSKNESCLNPTVRIALFAKAFEKLSNFKDDRSLEVILSCLEDPCAEVRTIVYTSLSKFRQSEALKRLILSGIEESIEVRSHAFQVLEENYPDWFSSKTALELVSALINSIRWNDGTQASKVIVSLLDIIDKNWRTGETALSYLNETHERILSVIGNHYSKGIMLELAKVRPFLNIIQELGNTESVKILFNALEVISRPDVYDAIIQKIIDLKGDFSSETNRRIITQLVVYFRKHVDAYGISSVTSTLEKIIMYSWARSDVRLSGEIMELSRSIAAQVCKCQDDTEISTALFLLEKVDDEKAYLTLVDYLDKQKFNNDQIFLKYFNLVTNNQGEPTIEKVFIKMDLIPSLSKDFEKWNPVIDLAFNNGPNTLFIFLTKSLRRIDNEILALNERRKNSDPQYRMLNPTFSVLIEERVNELKKWSVVILKRVISLLDGKMGIDKYESTIMDCILRNYEFVMSTIFSKSYREAKVIAVFALMRSEDRLLPYLEKHIKFMDAIPFSDGLPFCSSSFVNSILATCISKTKEKHTEWSGRFQGCIRAALDLCPARVETSILQEIAKLEDYSWDSWDIDIPSSKVEHNEVSFIIVRELAIKEIERRKV